MNPLFCLANSLPLPGGSPFVCSSFGDCLMTLLQITLIVWIVFAALGAMVDIAMRRKGPTGHTDSQGS